MKRTITTFALLIIIASTISAQKLVKPTNQEIVTLIKKSFEKDISGHGLLFGLPYRVFNEHEYTDFKINSIKITKVGKASSNYYESSGNYIDSYFYVKVIVDGSAELKEAVCLDSKYGYLKESIGKCGYKKRVEGRIKFRDIEQKFQIATDDYGDWYARYSWIANDDDEISEEQDYLYKIYKQQNPNEEIVLKKQAQEKQAQNEFSKELQKRQDLIDKVRGETILRLGIIKNKLSKREDLKAYQKLENKCVKEEWICGYDVTIFESFYLPLVDLQKRYDGKIVKILEQRPTSSKENTAFMKVLNRFFEKHPDVKKKFYSKRLSMGYKSNFSEQISNQKSEEAKYLVFLELSKGLMKIKFPE